MSDIDLAELRRIAEEATPGPWTLTTGREYQAESDPVEVAIEVTSPALGIWQSVVDWHPDECVVARPNDAAYLGAVSPDTVLALLDRIEEAEESARFCHEQEASLRDEIEALEADRDDLLKSITELAPSDEVEVEGSIFERAELPQVLRNVMRHLDDSRREAKAMYLGREGARAALARVTDDSMAERIKEVPLTWTKRMSDGHLSTGDRSADEIAADVLTVIRAAADEQPEHIHEDDVFRAGECCGAPHCKAAPHVEGCFATDPDVRDDRPVAADEQEAVR